MRPYKPLCEQMGVAGAVHARVREGQGDLFQWQFWFMPVPNNCETMALLSTLACLLVCLRICGVLFPRSSGAICSEK